MQNLTVSEIQKRILAAADVVQFNAGEEVADQLRDLSLDMARLSVQISRPDVADGAYFRVVAYIMHFVSQARVGRDQPAPSKITLEEVMALNDPSVVRYPGVVQ